MPSAIEFDWSQGRAFVQDGTIFYSPNCSRTVVVPASESIQSPFNHEHLNASIFRQPVWWSDVYGWQSFIPLAPSYASVPFEPFCWMPRIVEADVLVDGNSCMMEKRFQMNSKDYSIWTEQERLLTEAAQRIRIWYKIPGTLPPAPSMFHYGQMHKSRGVARRMITLARDWFAVWMGFVSYLIASTERFSPSSSPLYDQPDPKSPVPIWYSRLLEKHGYPANWLDGLTCSAVCSFDMKTPRAGVVFRWSRPDVNRPSFEWFFSRRIPMWFVWSKAEEQAISENRSNSFLLPPSHLIQEALTLLFTTPDPGIPLAGLILQRYYDMGSDMLTNESTKWSDQCTQAHTEATFPTQTMLEGIQEKGTLYNHWSEFFTTREKQQAELIKVETFKQRRTRLSREKQPAVQNATMYTWHKIQSSGGKEVYMRLQVNKYRNKKVFLRFKDNQKVYNPNRNEWDLCKEFDNISSDNCFDNKHHAEISDINGSLYDSDESSEFDEDYDEDSELAASTPPRLTLSDYQLEDVPYSQDVIQTLSYGYGYVPSISSANITQIPDKEWENVLLTLGFIPSSERAIENHEKQAISEFLSNMLKNTSIPTSSDDLSLECSMRHRGVSDPYVPPSFRLANHIFTVQDFDAYMLRCQAILSQPQGRAALLYGGIIWRIAKEFLSIDGALAGPSVEVTAHRVGYIHPSKNDGIQYCDDALTENEVAAICGTYSLYTQFGQITVKSWFPPPICWSKDRTGVSWVEWTGQNEQFFGDLLRNIRAGTAKPLTVIEWTSRLRGLKTSRILRDRNRNQADTFTAQYIPVE
ncbi:hypothetical protein BDN70DRAFT_818581 [Pholiota conissans]|uniref:Uncharacterized protein n=1 Tax=Pholiota conissans TaxID=109636 RepID=A0A9P6CSW6_9AGAR|nr:hypothetical protein BDN70DRAFT_818581 [Pholiota conissans]